MGESERYLVAFHNGMKGKRQYLSIAFHNGMYKSGWSNCISEAATSSALYDRAFRTACGLKGVVSSGFLGKKGTVVLAFSGIRVGGKL